MKHLLLVDDQSKDLMIASSIAESLGIQDVQAKNSIPNARKHLERALKGEVPLPDVIVLDLDLGLDSGFELLRMWHATPTLRNIPVIVWSVMEGQRQICELFKVRSFVPKWQGAPAFRAALAQAVS